MLLIFSSSRKDVPEVNVPNNSRVYLLRQIFFQILTDVKRWWARRSQCLSPGKIENENSSEKVLDFNEEAETQVSSKPKMAMGKGREDFACFTPSQSRAAGY